MSKIKPSPEKKRLSLERDRRNTYGENAKSSRKNIPRSKQIQHQAERRSANQTLIGIENYVDEDRVAEAELNSITKIIEKRRKGFAKSPDKALGVVVQNKIVRRNALSSSKNNDQVL